MMFCPNCGAKIESAAQKFCSNCGSTITEESFLDTQQEPPRTSQITPTPTLQPSKHYHPDADKYAKAALILSIASGILAFVGWYIGFLVFLLQNLIGDPSIFPLAREAGWITVYILHGIGALFGILALTNSSSANRLDPESGISKAGQLIGLLGLIANIILIFVAIGVNVFKFSLGLPFYP